MKRYYFRFKQSLGRVFLLCCWLGVGCGAPMVHTRPSAGLPAEKQKEKDQSVRVVIPMASDSREDLPTREDGFSPSPQGVVEPPAGGVSEEMANSLEQATLGLAKKQVEVAQSLFTVTMPKYQEPGGSSQPVPVQLERMPSTQPEPGPGPIKQPETQSPLGNPSNDRQAQKTPVVVAVFDIQDASKKKPVEADTLEQLTEYLAAQLTEQAGFRVVPRNQLRERLAEQRSESYKKCYDEGCQIELGKAVAAQKSLATKLLRVGNKCAITAILYDLKTETTENATSADTDCNEDSLIEGVRTIARKLSGKDVN